MKLERIGSTLHHILTVSHLELKYNFGIAIFTSCTNATDVNALVVLSCVSANSDAVKASILDIDEKSDSVE